MTRKQRGGKRSITYDLSQPRNLAAFQALMVDEEAEEAEAAARSRCGVTSVVGLSLSLCVLRPCRFACNDSTPHAAQRRSTHLACFAPPPSPLQPPGCLLN